MEAKHGEISRNVCINRSVEALAPVRRARGRLPLVAMLLGGVAFAGLMAPSNARAQADQPSAAASPGHGLNGSRAEKNAQTVKPATAMLPAVLMNARMVRASPFPQLRRG